MKKKYSLKDIKKTLKEKDAFSTVFFVDPIAIRLLYLVANFTNITPNQITIFSLIFGIIGFILGLIGFYFLSIVFFYIAFLFDCIDGKLSRLKKTSSSIGFIFDGLVDSIIILLYNILISYILIINNLEYYIILILVFNYIRLYKENILKYFNNFLSKTSILNKSKSEYRFSIFPNDVDIMYFFFIIGNLFLFGLLNYGYNIIIFIKINIILTTLFYIILFIVPLFVNFKRLGKIEKK